MNSNRRQLIQSLFDDYIEMYASRDDRLTARFSDDFSGYAGGGNVLVKDKDDWIKVTRHDFSQVTGRLRIEMLDLSMQDISDVVVTTAFFHIHLPIPEHVLSRETARLVLIFRREGDDWKIVHSGISIPYHLVQDGEVYPLKGLQVRNSELETLVEERTRELEQANAKLASLSNTDGLTGIANRRRFDQMLGQEWQRAQRSGSPLALMMLDVDHFKHFNDHYGHVAGDDCLRALAQVLLREVRRSGELVARYGGEGFVVLLPDTDAHTAFDVGQRIQQAVWSLGVPHAQVPSGIVTFSFGISSRVPSERHVPDDLVRHADLALYQAKETGRNCIQLAVD